ncbi:Hypothetical protein CINCED_3A004647 [Cinara cedri]|uniref:Uncharacterized protein n=1 Tax=Cinara cedri TaxID=506608 RepID=A0A5E4LZV2_9HEMI|nr:Hypothetical protein CINCED_3A004647 [Cinara cedri]
MNPTWVFAVLLITHSVYGTEGEQNQQTLTSSLLEANGSNSPTDGSANIGAKVISTPNEVKSTSLVGNDVSKASSSGTASGPDISGSTAPVVQPSVSRQKQKIYAQKNKHNSLPNKNGRSNHSGHHTAQSGSRAKLSKSRQQSKIIQNANPEVDHIQQI